MYGLAARVLVHLGRSWSGGPGPRGPRLMADAVILVRGMSRTSCPQVCTRGVGSSRGDSPTRKGITPIGGFQGQLGLPVLRGAMA